MYRLFIGQKIPQKTHPCTPAFYPSSKNTDSDRYIADLGYNFQEEGWFGGGRGRNGQLGQPALQVGQHRQLVQHVTLQPKTRVIICQAREIPKSRLVIASYLYKSVLSLHLTRLLWKTFFSILSQ